MFADSVRVHVQMSHPRVFRVGPIKQCGFLASLRYWQSPSRPPAWTRATYMEAVITNYSTTHGLAP